MRASRIVVIATTVLCYCPEVRLERYGMLRTNDWLFFGVLCPSSGLRFSPSVLSAPLALYARVTRLLSLRATYADQLLQALEGVPL